LLQSNRIDGCIAVQARESLEETVWLLDIAEKNTHIKGVVGWVDICSPGLEGQLERLAEAPKLKGFRHVLQSENNEFMLQPNFIRGLEILGKYDYSYDILVHSGQLDIVYQLVERLPVMRLVLDHICKPVISQKTWQPWADEIRKLSEFSHVYCKVSGMVTEADFTSWKVSEIEPYIEHVAKCFGQKRLLFGSDWPVCLLASDYQRTTELVENYFDKFSDDASCDVMGENAIKFYRLD
jgi:L-fuconolactonase